jgi:hypothetical protein
MFGIIVKVPSGTRAVVNDVYTDRQPLEVGKDDPVYFLSTERFGLNVSATSTCKEGIEFNITISLKLSLDDGNLKALVADAGASTVKNTVTIRAENRAKQFNIENSVESAIHSVIQTSSFFDLEDVDKTKEAIQKLVDETCKAACLCGVVEACQEYDFTPPDDKLLMAIAAKAGRSIIKEGTNPPQVSYREENLGRVVERFESARRQQEELEIEFVRHAEEIAQHKIRAQYETKIMAIKLDNDLQKAADDLDKAQKMREREKAERNKEILEQNASYDAEYKRRRQENELNLERAELLDKKEIAMLAAEVNQINMERKRLEIATLVLDRERALAEIRSQEIVEVCKQLAVIAKELRIPPADYSGVQTLCVSGGDGSKPIEMLVSLLIDMLSKRMPLNSVPTDPVWGIVGSKAEETTIKQ